MRKQNNGLLFHIIVLKVHTLVTMLSINVCLHHRILGFVKGTTARLLLALKNFSNCEHQDASSGD
jgi:hypothetical protein